MMNRFRQMLALLLTVVMLLGALPAPVYAESTAEPTEAAVVDPTLEPTADVTAEPTDELPVGDSLEDIVSAPVFTFDGYQTLEDFGIRSASVFAMRRSSPADVYLNPQTMTSSQEPRRRAVSSISPEG